MPRHSSGGNKLHGGDLIIQKQACSSPSSSTSTLKKQSLKRKVLVTKRRGSTTPVHLWRTHYRSPLSMAGFSESPQDLRSKDVDEKMQIPVSARKLGNALWVLNNSPSPKIAKKLQGSRSKMTELAKEGTSGCVEAVSLPLRMYNHTNNPLSDSNRSRSRRHRKMVLAVNESLDSKEQDSVAPDLMSKACLMRIEASSKDPVSGSSLVGSSKCFRELRNGLMTSKELIKILINFRGLLKHQTSAISLARVLYCQVDQALMLVDKLIQEKKYDQSEISRIIRKFMEEKEIWKSKKKEGIRIAVQPMIEELETERKLRRRAESRSENLRMELAQMKTSLVNANKELESERKTREMIEQVCGQMIRGIGDEKAEVEELKRESVKEREELEQERQMLQLADEWREERVQMKLSEAKYQFEEKNAAVDQLRYELEAFLAAKREQDTVNGPWRAADNLKDCLRQIVQPSSSSSSSEANLIMHTRDTGGGKDQEENDGTDSEDGDLHSIELNMDSNNNGYSWSHVSAVMEDGDLALTREKNEKSTKFRRIFRNDLPSDNSSISKEHFKNHSQDFDRNNLNEGRNVENSDRLGPSAERYIPLEVMRDKKLAGSSIILPLSLSSSTGQWSRQQTLENKVDQVTLVSKVSELVKAIRESESKASLEKKSKVHSHLQTAPIE